MEKAISGFRTSGVYPLNPDKFNNNDFAPSRHINNGIVEGAPHQEDLTVSSSKPCPSTSKPQTVVYDDQPSPSKDSIPIPDDQQSPSEDN